MVDNLELEYRLWMMIWRYRLLSLWIIDAMLGQKKWFACVPLYLSYMYHTRLELEIHQKGIYQSFQNLCFEQSDVQYKSKIRHTAFFFFFALVKYLTLLIPLFVSHLC